MTKEADREYLLQLSEQHSFEELVEKATSKEFFQLLVNVLTEPYVDDLTDLVLEIFYKLKDERVIQLAFELLKLEDEGLSYCGFLILHEVKPPEAVPFLLSQLNDPDAHDRGDAALILGEIGDERAVEPLILRFIEEGNIPSDSDNVVSEKTAHALGKIGGEKAFQFLLSAFHNKDYYNHVARSCLAEGLGYLGYKEATPVLVAALIDESKYVRQSAAYGLSILDDKNVVEPLIKALEDHDASVQRSVIYALGNLKDTRAVIPLTEILMGEQKEIQKNVIEALVKIDDNQAKDSILQFLEDYKNRSDVAINKAIEASIHFKVPEAIQAIIEIYKQNNTYKRRTVLEGLVYFRGEETDAIIKNALTKGDKNLRSQVIYVLGKYGTELDIPLLQRVENEPGIDDCSKEAISEAIEQIKSRSTPADKPVK